MSDSGSEGPAATDPMALYREGARALEAGRPGDAVGLLSKAAELAPTMAEAQRDLGLALDRMGRYADAADSLNRAVALTPDDAEALNGLGNALQAIGNHDEALDAYRAAVALAPDEAGIHVNMGNLMEEAGDYAGASGTYRHAIEREPALALAHYHLGRSMLAEGDAAGALEAVDRCLGLAPYLQQALALKGVLLQDLGRHRDAGALLDFDRFLRSFRPGPPPGYDDVATFHADLIEHIEAHPTLARDPYGSSTKGGLHSQNMLNDKVPVTDALKAMLQALFGRYVEELPHEPGHPFTGRQEPRARLNAQAQLLDPRGHLAPHVHESGWVSGAYYVRLPKTEGRQGCIEFGRPPAFIKHRSEQTTRIHRPEEGTAVLFPSYFFHGTLPAAGAVKRVSIGIDMIPLASPK